MQKLQGRGNLSRQLSDQLDHLSRLAASDPCDSAQGLQARRLVFSAWCSSFKHLS